MSFLPKARGYSAWWVVQPVVTKRLRVSRVLFFLFNIPRAIPTILPHPS